MNGYVSCLLDIYMNQSKLLALTDILLFLFHVLIFGWIGFRRLRYGQLLYALKFQISNFFVDYINLNLA